MSTPGRFHIDPDDPRPLYVQIMDEVRMAIANGSIGFDESLPSVRELAGELRLNPNTVQQAYRELEREGVVYVRRGQGTFVSPDAKPAALRDRILSQLARRTLREAARSGVGPDALIEAIREANHPRHSPPTEDP